MSGILACRPSATEIAARLVASVASPGVRPKALRCTSIANVIISRSPSPMLTQHPRCPRPKTVRGPTLI